MIKKYSKDLDEEFVKLVLELSTAHNLKNIQAIKLNKISNNPCYILKCNELTKLFLSDDIIVIAIYEEAFRSVDKKTQVLWIENLLSRIEYNNKKDITEIRSPDIEFTVDMYNIYKDTLVYSLILGKEIIQKLKDAEKQKKETEKLNKQFNKNKKYVNTTNNI